MEVEIFSEECIKPSSSTPSQNKTYKVSLFDQFMPPIYFSTALFYPNNPTTTNISQQRSLLLKRSLSETLSRFYPLAGNIKDYVSIDCNDHGAYYSEARANIPLSEYLARLDLTTLKRFVPDASRFNENPIGASVVMIQETTFSCGGLAIGLSVSHMVLDGISFASFIKDWASAASSSGEITYPYLDAPFEFPLYDNFPKEALVPSLWTRFVRKEKIVVKRLLFDTWAIEKLKSQAKGKGGVGNPSRVEVVSAVISRSLMAALKAKSIVISHAVNMRQKATPPIPNCSLGNYIWTSQAICTAEETQLLSSLVYHLRNAIRRLDTEFLKDAKEGGFQKLFKELKDMGSRFSQDDGMQAFPLASWCNFGLYNDADFGFGKPIWISLCTMADSEEVRFYNNGKLIDTRNGNGVEAWLYLSQDIAAALDKDDELLQYVSLNPSPLIHVQ